MVSFFANDAKPFKTKVFYVEILCTFAPSKKQRWHL
jgi:hypothetical protein